MTANEQNRQAIERGGGGERETSELLGPVKEIRPIQIPIKAEIRAKSSPVQSEFIYLNNLNKDEIEVNKKKNEEEFKTHLGGNEPVVEKSSPIKSSAPRVRYSETVQDIETKEQYALVNRNEAADEVGERQQNAARDLKRSQEEEEVDDEEEEGEVLEEQKPIKESVEEKKSNPILYPSSSPPKPETPPQLLPLAPAVTRFNLNSPVASPRVLDRNHLVSNSDSANLDPRERRRLKLRLSQVDSSSKNLHKEIMLNYVNLFILFEIMLN